MSEELLRACRAKLLKLAEQRELACGHMRVLGSLNVYVLHDPEQRLKFDIELRLALDAFEKADADYRQAIHGLTASELMAISQLAGRDAEPTPDAGA